jgi:adenylate cyclase
LTGERVERRLAAVLAADVAGYSRLMGRDEERTLANLKSYRKLLVDPAIVANRGRVVKTTGDGMLAEFASAVDATRCAIEVQRGMAEKNADIPQDARIEFRIGIHVGDIIIDDNDIFGDGVNIAARLEGIAEPGGVAISRAAHEQVRDRLDVTFTDRGELTFKNIARPVQVFAVVISDAAAGSRSDPKLVLSLPDKPSIAVLPFQNMSGDPEQEYFADGITEDIITLLSKWRSFLVIARNSTFTYKGRSVDVKQVGRELGAQYLLEGSVRKSGQRLRVTAQLVETAQGAHVWAERYDREITDVFAIQDDVSERIAAVIEPELGRHEQLRLVSKSTTNLGAWDCLSRGLYLVNKFNNTDNAAARSLFERAIALDPQFSRAHASLAYTYQQDILHAYTADRANAIERQIASARLATQLDPKDSYAHSMLAFAYRWARRHDLMIAEARKALEYNPSDAWAAAVLGLALDLAGQHREGIESFKRSMALNPRDPRLGYYVALIARAYLVDHDYETAENWAHRAIELDPSMPRSHLILAAILGHLGRSIEAHFALDTAERLHPGFARQWINGREYRDDVDNDHIAEGLRMAGLPP